MQSLKIRYLMDFSAYQSQYAYYGSYWGEKLSKAAFIFSCLFWRFISPKLFDIEGKFRENANQARISSRCVYHNCAVCSVWGWGNFFKQHHYFKIMILFVLKSIRISKFGIKCLICQLNFLLIKDLPRQKAMFSKIESFLSLKTILSIIINLCWVCLFILQFGTGCSLWD